MMKMEEMAETEKEERAFSACAVQAKKAPKELMEASAE